MVQILLSVQTRLVETKLTIKIKINTQIKMLIHILKEYSVFVEKSKTRTLHLVLIVEVFSIRNQ